MESYGEYLKSLREERGVSLEEISESTKIALANLRFLEEDRYDLLPPSVFVKGFIRSYTETLGLDPEDNVRRFEEFTRQGEAQDYYEEDHPIFSNAPRASDSFIKTKVFTVVLTTAGLISFVILLLTGVSRLVYDDSKGVMNPNVSVAGPSSLSGQTETPIIEDPAPTGRLTLEITATANSWVRVQPDSGPAKELLMTKGEVEVVTAEKGFFLQTGNAGGIQISLNGEPYQPIGKMNQAVAIELP